jgi:hypothetical protein
MTDKRLAMLHRAIVVGDVRRARQMVKILAQKLPDNPDVYYYAAYVARDKAHAERMVNRALELDSFHSGTNRLQYQISEIGYEAARAEPPDAPRNAPLTDTTSVPVVKLADLQARQRQRRRWWRNVPRGRLMTLVVSGVILSVSSSWLLMLMLGIGSQFINPVATFLGAPAPIMEHEGRSIIDYANPAELEGLGASYNTEFGRGEAGTTGDILRDGAMHEYELEARAGEEIAIAVQFFSPFADNVPENVAVIDPAGRLADDQCERDYILDQYTGIVYICDINVSGVWKVRIFGKERESSGVYVVTADTFAG